MLQKMVTRLTAGSQCTTVAACKWLGLDSVLHGSCGWGRQVCQIANYLRSVGVKRGDDVTIYMPMIPELPAAMVQPHACHII